MKIVASATTTASAATTTADMDHYPVFCMQQFENKNMITKNYTAAAADGDDNNNDNDGCSDW